MALSNDEILQTARSLATPMKDSGDIPEDVSDSLDGQFVEVAPPGARIGGDLHGLMDYLSRFQFEPGLSVETTRRRFRRLVRLVKVVLRPVSVLLTRRLAAQLNVHHALQMEVIRGLFEQQNKGRR
jgi:hypothetical protein